MMKITTTVLVCAAVVAAAVVEGRIDARHQHGGHTGAAAVDGAGVASFTSPGSQAEYARVMAQQNIPNLNPAGSGGGRGGDSAKLRGGAGQTHAAADSSADDEVVLPPVEGAFVNPSQDDFVEEGELEVDQNETTTTVAGRLLNVFLPDTRSTVDSTVYPYRTVGSFNGCTATLVYASGIVITNAHCLRFKPDGTMDPSTWNTVFYAGFRNGVYAGASTAKALWYNAELDYAVLKLKVPLDSTLGRYGLYWRDAKFFATDRALAMISYSGDHCNSWSNCQAKRSYGSTKGLVNVKSITGKSVITDIKHNLDAKRGSSGSVMYEWPTGSCCPIMDALNHAEFRGGGESSLTLNAYSAKYANLARPSIDWKYGYDQIKNL